MTREGENLKKDILSLMTSRLCKLFWGREKCTTFLFIHKCNSFDILLGIMLKTFIVQMNAFLCGYRTINKIAIVSLCRNFEIK